MSERPHEIWDEEGHADFLERVWGPPGHERGRHWDCLNAIAKLIRGKTVLDAACGQGHLYPVLLKNKPDVEYYGFDNSIEQLKKAWKAFPEIKDRLVQGDAYDLSNFVLKEFDSVVCVDLLMHIPEIETPIEQMWLLSRREMIIVAQVAVDKPGFAFRKPHLQKKQYSGEIELQEGKVLINRSDSLEKYYSIFGKLEDIGILEVFYYDAKAMIFRLTRGIPKYDSRRGWPL